jgi:hypothetical protein
MSGAKRISVDQADWDRAQQAARNLAQVRRDLPGMLENVRRQNQADLNRVFTAVSRRQEQAEQALAGLSSWTRDLEARTNQQLRAQAAQLQGLRAESRQQAKELRQEIGRERGERKKQFKQLDQKISNLKAGRDQASERANAIYQDARRMRAAIQAMPHERFVPGQLARLERRLDDAGQTMRDQEGAYSLGYVQELYQDLSDLRADVQLLEQAWLHAQVEALAALRTVHETVKVNAEVPSGAVPDTKIDVDYWTDGGLTALLAEIEETTQTAGGDSPLTVEQLRALIQENVPQYEQRLDALVARADDRSFASQARVNTAEHMVDVLVEQGYVFVDETYEGSDFRGAHFSKVKDVDDAEVVMEIAPEGDTGMTIRVLSYDDDRAGTRRAKRISDLYRSMRENDLPVSAPVDTGDEPRPEDRDFQAIRERRRRSR